MNGNELLNQLDDLIAYENSPYVSITVAADMEIVNEIRPLNGTYSKDYKATDKIELTVSEKSSYQFVKWNIEPADSVKYLDETTAKSKKIKIEILKSEKEITIEPVCAIKPSVTLIPENRSEGVQKNTSILLTFSKPMELNSEQIAQIGIECNGEDLRQYFNDGELSADKTQLSFTPKRSNLFPQFSGVKTVYITIPYNFAYNAGILEEPEYIIFGNEQVLTYRINNNTCEQIKVSAKDTSNSKGELTLLGKNVLNLDESVSFSFNPSEAYQLTGWEITNKNGSALPAEPKLFDLEYSDDLKKIEITLRAFFTDYEELLVNPVVYERPQVTFAPVNSQGAQKKNVPIQIFFTKPMDLTQTQIDSIKITSSDDDYSSFYEKGKLSSDKKTITFYADETNLIPAFNDVKLITVTVPGTFGYNAGADEAKISIGLNKINTFSIINETEKFVNITPQVQNGTGDISYNAQKVYYIGEYAEYSFVPSKKYEITGWDLIYPGEEGAVPETIITKTVSEDFKTVGLKILQGTDEEIILKPVCQLKKTLNVELTADYANVSPSEPKSYQLNEEFSIDCREDSEYYFLGWKVYETNGQEITDYSNILEIDNPSTQRTTVKVLGVQKSVVIKPVLKKCPKIVSTTPAYNSNGVFKNSKIVIMFDKPMDPSSIYFTKEELKALKSDIATLLPGDVTTPAENVNYYGYKSKNGEIIFKNIKITKFTDESVSYLNCYGEPSFDENNTRVLRIPTKHQASEADTLPGCEDIMVIISKKVCYKNGDDLVPMYNDFNFTYRTNSGVDSTPPELVKFDDSETGFAVKIVTGTEQYPGYSQTWVNAASSTALSKANIQGLNAKKKMLWLRGIITDGDSGPTSIEWEISKVQDTQTEPETPIYSLSAQNAFTPISGIIQGFNVVNGTDGRINEILDLSEYNFQEGYYKLTLTSKDLNDNKKVHPENFYFVYDNETVEVKFTDVCKRENKFQEKLAWKFYKNNEELNFSVFPPDTKKIEIKCFKSNDLSEANQLGNPKDVTSIINQTTIITTTNYALENKKKYYYTISLYDWAGNVTTDEYHDDTPPVKIEVNPTVSYRNSETEEVIFIVDPSTLDYTECKLEYYDEKTPDVVNTYPLTTVAGAHTITGLQNHHKYVYKITTYDGAGNENYSTYVDEKPAKTVEKFRALGDEEKVTIRWNLWDDYSPVEGVEKFVVSCSDGTSFDISPTATLSKDFSGLQNNKKYSFKVKTVYFNGMESPEKDISGYYFSTWENNKTFGGLLGLKTENQGTVKSNIVINNVEYPKTSEVIAIPSGAVYQICFNNSIQILNGSVFADGTYIQLSPFAVSQYEVTSRLYNAVMEKGEQGDDTPAININKNDAITFCKKLNEILGLEATYNSNDDVDLQSNGYRLLTEAEWEFCARGGNPNNEIWKNYKISCSANQATWKTESLEIVGNSNVRKNILNIYDMTGNVWEWCQDYFGNHNISANSNVYTVDPIILSGSGGIIRGGSYNSPEDYGNVTKRVKCSNNDKEPVENGVRLGALGFRICRSIDRK